VIENVDAHICDLSRAPQPIQTPTLKVGGAPVLLDQIEWPVCRECGQPMDFLAQVPLNQPVAFSCSYTMAYVFMCPGKFDERGWLQCQTWDAFAGANKVVLQSGPGTAIVAGSTSTYPDYCVNIRHTKEPLVDTSDFELDDDLREAVSWSTKIGGVPAWIQNNDTPRCPNCGEVMRFVAQLNAELDGPLPSVRQWNDEKYKFLNFGDAGLGYLFICEKECGAHGAAFLWQTC
jgi:hypothetical protein